jgi:hypothetical protein
MRPGYVIFRIEADVDLDHDDMCEAAKEHIIRLLDYFSNNPGEISWGEREDAEVEERSMSGWMSNRQMDEFFGAE